MARYRNRQMRRYFLGDAAFAKPEIYEFLEAEGYAYTIRLPTFERQLPLSWFGGPFYFGQPTPLGEVRQDRR